MNSRIRTILWIIDVCIRMTIRLMHRIASIIISI
jgi:hypothetical protein